MQQPRVLVLLLQRLKFSSSSKLNQFYRCKSCRQNNIPLVLQETLSDLDEKFNKFKNNYENLLKIVMDLKSENACLPTLKNDVQYVKSDLFSEKLIAESVLRMKKAKNIIIYEVPENMENFGSDVDYVKNALADVPISLEGIKCYRREVSKAGSPKPLVVTFNDTDSVSAVFQNKNKLKENIVIKKDRTKQEGKLLRKAINEINDRNARGERNLRIKYINNIPTVTQDMNASNDSYLNASSITHSPAKNGEDHPSTN